MLNRVVFFIIVIISFSCSPQKRLTRLLRNHPELITKVDSVTVKDTFVVKEQHFDTVISNYFDTARIYTTDSLVRVKLIKIHDSVKVEIQLKGDTLIITKRVPYKKIEIKKGEKPFYRDWWFWISVVLFINVFLVFRAWIR